jgi:RHS repeat-associated protein
VKTAVNGTEAERWDHYPYGETWVPGAPGDQHRYTGHLRDAESGNDIAGARYYSSARGRWLGVDPVPGDLANPQRLNRYAYVLNNPINYVDPDGRGEEPFDTGFRIVVSSGVLCATVYVQAFRHGLFGVPQRPGKRALESEDRTAGPDAALAAWQELNQQAQSELRQFLQSPCRRHLESWAAKSGKAVAEEASRMKFYDIRDGSPWQNLSLASIGVQPTPESGWDSRHTLLQFWNWGAGESVARLVAVGDHFRSSRVLLGPKFFDDAYLADEGLTRRAVFGHELFHFVSGLDDAGLARALGLAPHADGPSAAIQRYLEAGCPES